MGDTRIFTIKKGSREPALKLTAYQSAGVVYDLTGSSITFKMTERVTNAVKVNDQAAVITDAANGQFEYRWAAADVDTVGDYDGSVTITLPGGKPLILPTEGYVHVQVNEAR